MCKYAHVTCPEMLSVNHCFQLDVLFGNVVEMLDFQVEFLRTLEDGTRLVPDLEKLEKVDHFKVDASSQYPNKHVFKKKKKHF